MENAQENVFNLDTQEILHARRQRQDSDLFIQMRAIIEQQAARLKQLEDTVASKGPKKG